MLKVFFRWKEGLVPKHRDVFIQYVCLTLHADENHDTHGRLYCSLPASCLTGEDATS